MPTIKGGITFGKNMSKEDLEKYAKATGRDLIGIKGEPIKKKKVVKKKVVK
jgi:hypothetical protein